MLRRRRVTTGMHYHHRVHSDRVFRSLDALDDYCHEHGGDPTAVQFCLDGDCLRPPRAESDPSSPVGED